MRTLVTGGPAGFIGSHLVRALVDRERDVAVRAFLEEQVHGDAAKRLPEDVTFARGNVAAYQALERVDQIERIVASGRLRARLAGMMERGLRIPRRAHFRISTT